MVVGSMVGMMWALALIFSQPFNGSSQTNYKAWQYIEKAFTCEEAPMSSKLSPMMTCLSSISPQSSTDD